MATAVKEEHENESRGGKRGEGGGGENNIALVFFSVLLLNHRRVNRFSVSRTMQACVLVPTVTPLHMRFCDTFFFKGKYF